ncbi:MAG: hypothetical protein RIS70_1767 [Planctomycetota bacterium]
MLTFGDLMLLLLTFFVMIVAMSEIKTDDRSLAVLRSLRAHFGARADADFRAPTREQSKVAVLANRFHAYREHVLQTRHAQSNALSSAAGSPPDRVFAIHLQRSGHAPRLDATVFVEDDLLDRDAMRNLGELKAKLSDPSKMIEVRAYLAPPIRALDVAIQRAAHFQLSDSPAKVSLSDDGEEEMSDTVAEVISSEEGESSTDLELDGPINEAPLHEAQVIEQHVTEPEVVEPEIVEPQVVEPQVVEPEASEQPVGESNRGSGQSLGRHVNTLRTGGRLIGGHRMSALRVRDDETPEIAPMETDVRAQAVEERENQAQSEGEVASLIKETRQGEQWVEFESDQAATDESNHAAEEPQAAQVDEMGGDFGGENVSENDSENDSDEWQGSRSGRERGETEHRWQDAMKRAMTVARFLTNDLGIPPERIRMTVEGREPQRSEGSVAENHLRSARVDLYLLNEVVGRSRTVSRTQRDLAE